MDGVVQGDYIHASHTCDIQDLLEELVEIVDICQSEDIMLDIITNSVQPLEHGNYTQRTAGGGLKLPTDGRSGARLVSHLPGTARVQGTVDTCLGSTASGTSSDMAPPDTAEQQVRAPVSNGPPGDPQPEISEPGQLVIDESVQEHETDAVFSIGHLSKQKTNQLCSNMSKEQRVVPITCRMDHLTAEHNRTDPLQVAQCESHTNTSTTTSTTTAALQQGSRPSISVVSNEPPTIKPDVPSSSHFQISTSPATAARTLHTSVEPAWTVVHSDPGRSNCTTSREKSNLIVRTSSTIHQNRRSTYMCGRGTVRPSGSVLCEGDLSSQSSPNGTFFMVEQEQNCPVDLSCRPKKHSDMGTCTETKQIPDPTEIEPIQNRRDVVVTNENTTACNVECDQTTRECNNVCHPQVILNTASTEQGKVAPVIGITNIQHMPGHKSNDLTASDIPTQTTEKFPVDQPTEHSAEQQEVRTKQRILRKRAMAIVNAMNARDPLHGNNEYNKAGKQARTDQLADIEVPPPEMFPLVQPNAGGDMRQFLVPQVVRTGVQPVVQHALGNPLTGSHVTHHHDVITGPNYSAKPMPTRKHGMTIANQLPQHHVQGWNVANMNNIQCECPSSALQLNTCPFSPPILLPINTASLTGMQYPLDHVYAPNLRNNVDSCSNEQFHHHQMTGNPNANERVTDFQDLGLLEFAKQKMQARNKHESFHKDPLSQIQDAQVNANRTIQSREMIGRARRLQRFREYAIDGQIHKNPGAHSQVSNSPVNFLDSTQASGQKLQQCIPAQPPTNSLMYGAHIQHRYPSQRQNDTHYSVQRPDNVITGKAEGVGVRGTHEIRTVPNPGCPDNQIRQGRMDNLANTSAFHSVSSHRRNVTQLGCFQPSTTHLPLTPAKCPVVPVYPTVFGTESRSRVQPEVLWRTESKNAAPAPVKEVPESDQTFMVAEQPCVVRSVEPFIVTPAVSTTNSTASMPDYRRGPRNAFPSGRTIERMTNRHVPLFTSTENDGSFYSSTKYGVPRSPYSLYKQSEAATNVAQTHTSLAGTNYSMLPSGAIQANTAMETSRLSRRTRLQSLPADETPPEPAQKAGREWPELSDTMPTGVRNDGTVIHIMCSGCTNRARFLCSRCKKVAYCSLHCQLIAWSNHKSVCFV